MTSIFVSLLYVWNAFMFKSGNAFAPRAQVGGGGRKGALDISLSGDVRPGPSNPDPV